MNKNTKNEYYDCDNLIGRMAYKKYGFFGGLVGVIKASESGVTKFVIEFPSGAKVGFSNVSDIELVDN